MKTVTKINQIIKNDKAKLLDNYILYENKYVSLDSMQRLLNLDTTEKDHNRNWITDKVINFYFKKYLAEMDPKQCQEEPEQNCSGFLKLFFLQCLTNKKNDNKTLQGTYYYENVSRWARNLPGKDIFNLI
jgi:Ulp1 family protease